MEQFDAVPAENRLSPSNGISAAAFEDELTRLGAVALAKVSFLSLAPLRQPRVPLKTR